MEIKLDDASLQKLLGEAIVQAMDQKGKDAIIAQALTYLTTRKKENDGYNARVISPIEQAFERAVRNAAERFAEEVVKTPEFEAQMSEVVKEATQAIFSSESRSVLISNLRQGIYRAFSGDR